MAKKGVKTAVPKLRFPEFRNAAVWQEEKLEVLIDTVSPPVKLQSASYQTTGKFPVIDQSQDAICGWTDDVQAVVEGPLPLIVFGDHTCALKFVETPFAQGADGIKILTAKPAVSIQYLFHSLNHRPLVMEDYRRHFSTLKERRVFFPNVESGEQQKIADCLTSLDEVIAAQGRKVEALKAHKRGLMQQLFPREGETRPRLRFPEFRNAPEWRSLPLGEVAEIKLGKMLDANKNRSGHLLPYVNNISLRWNEVDTSDLPQMYFNESELERFGLQKGDVLVCEGGEPGRSAVWDGRLPNLKFQKAVHRVRFHVPFVPKILVLYLEAIAGTNAFESLFTGGGIKHLTGETFAKLAIPLMPLPEQQRIADCLSSLDTQITAETNQLAALKTHKQGLMQQLFPAPEAVQA